jgi:hypothetical protein
MGKTFVGGWRETRRQPVNVECGSSVVAVISEFEIRTPANAGVGEEQASPPAMPPRST